jgi:hypothetical protein
MNENEGREVARDGMECGLSSMKRPGRRNERE